MDKNKKNLISILRSVVCQDGTQIPSDVDWLALWKLAQRNHLEVIVYKAMPCDIADKLKNEYFKMTGRSIKQEHLLGQIEEALKNTGVHYAPQKGSVLKYDYPGMHLRFMSDMDFYIRPEDRSRISTAIEKMGGTLSGTESGDVQFLFPGNLGVEFHGRLLYRKQIKALKTIRTGVL